MPMMGGININSVGYTNILITSSVPSSATLAADDMPCHASQEDNQEKETGRNTQRKYHKLSLVLSKKESNISYDLDHKPVSNKKSSCMQKNLPNSFIKKFPSNTLSKGTNAQYGNQIQSDLSKKKRIGLLLEGNPFKGNAKDQNRLCSRVHKELSSDEEDANITLPDLDGSFNTCRDFNTSEKENINKTNLTLKRKCSLASPQKHRKKMLSRDQLNFLHSFSSEDLSTSTVEEDDGIDKSSRLRDLFLDIVSSKKSSDIMKTIDIEYLKADLSPIRENSSAIDEVIDLNADDRQKKNNTRLVRSLTRPQLKHIFRKHLSKLNDICCRKEYCRRHEDFVRGGRANRDLTCQVNLSPFNNVQMDYLMKLLISEFYRKRNVDADYIFKVLLPETLIIIFMEFHGTDYEKSDKLMEEAAFNEDCVEIL